MTIQIEGVGIWKQRLGANIVKLRIEGDSNVSQLMNSLQSRCPDLVQMRHFTIVCVNNKVADESHMLSDGDQILLMSAIAGG